MPRISVPAFPWPSLRVLKETRTLWIESQPLEGVKILKGQCHWQASRFEMQARSKSNRLSCQCPRKPKGSLGKDSFVLLVLVHVPDQPAFDRHSDAGAVTVTGEGNGHEMFTGAGARVDPLPPTGLEFDVVFGTVLCLVRVMIDRLGAASPSGTVCLPRG